MDAAAADAAAAGSYYSISRDTRQKFGNEKGRQGWWECNFDCIKCRMSESDLGCALRRCLLWRQLTGVDGAAAADAG